MTATIVPGLRRRCERTHRFGTSTEPWQAFLCIMVKNSDFPIDFITLRDMPGDEQICNQVFPGDARERDGVQWRAISWVTRSSAYDVSQPPSSPFRRRPGAVCLRGIRGTGRTRRLGCSPEGRDRARRASPARRRDRGARYGTRERVGQHPPEGIEHRDPPCLR